MIMGIDDIQVAFDVEWVPDTLPGHNHPAAVLQLAFVTGTTFVVRTRF